MEKMHKGNTTASTFAPACSQMVTTNRKFAVRTHKIVFINHLLGLSPSKWLMKTILWVRTANLLYLFY